MKLAGLAEAGEVPAEAEPALPGEADQLLPPIDDALAEQIGRDRDAAEHLAVLQPHLADVGAALQPSALEQPPAAVEEAFGEGVAVVRIGVDDAHARDRRRLRR